MIQALSTTQMSRGGQCRPSGTRRACAALMLTISLVGLADAAPGPGAGGAAAGNPAPAAGQSPDADDSLIRTVPAECRKPDGSVDHEFLVAYEKKRVDALGRKLNIKFTTTETPHFLVASGAGPAATDLLVKGCETLYANLTALFGMEKDARLCDGKCMLFLFGQRATLERYATTIDGPSAANVYGYFRIDRYGGRLGIAKVLLVDDGQGPAKLMEHLVHEETHALFCAYTKDVGVPRWVHEGIADYMTTVNDQNLRGPKIAKATSVARGGGSLKRVFQVQNFADVTYEDVCVSMTVVEYLVAAGKPKFRKFVDAMKDGKSQEEALPAAYGFTMTDLEKRWRAYVVDYLPRRGKTR